MRIYIYGAGKYGHYVYDEIVKCRNSKIEVLGWIDQDESKKEILPKFTAEEFFKIDRSLYDAVVVAIENRKFMTQIVRLLLRNGISKVYAGEENVCRNRLEVMNHEGGFSELIRPYAMIKPWLSNAQFPIVTHCNLNCRRCGAFSNISKESYADLETFEKTLYGLKEKFSIVSILVLVGGEPLLHPQLIEFIKKVHEILPRTMISICTNGILLLKLEEDVIEGLRKYNVWLQITRYPVTEKILPDLIEFLKKNQLAYELSPLRSEFARSLSKEGKSKQLNMPFSEDACIIGRLCYCVYDGTIYTCNLPNDLYLNKDYLGIEITKEEKDGVGADLIHGKENGWEVLDKINTPHQLCRYCVETEYFQWSNQGEPCAEDYIR